MKLNHKFFFFFFLFSALPIIIITSIISYSYSSTTHAKMDEIYSNIYLGGVAETNEILNETNNIFDTVSYYSDNNGAINNNLKKYTTNNFTNADKLTTNNIISSMYLNLKYTNPYINGIFIFTPSGQKFGYGDNIAIFPRYLPFEDDWYKKTLSYQGKTFINGLSQKAFIINASPSITFSRAFYDTYTKEFLGVILIDFDSEYFDLSRINSLPEKVFLYLEDTQGNIIYSNSDAPLSKSITNNTLINVYDFSISNIKLTISSEKDILYQQASSMSKIIFILALIYMIGFMFLSWLLSKHLTEPITFLSKKMALHKLQPIADKEEYLQRTDEIGILYNEYNNMIETQNTFVKEEYQNKIIALDSQMKALEAQINSHFLYNTLESINSIAEIEEIHSISVMSLALGNMFRYSIKAQSELVTLREEINNVKDYIAIQKIRFSNKFDLIVDIPENIYKYKILKLILQPIVENSLLHGLKSCSYGDRICISAKKNHMMLSITIEDNGIGIPLEHLSQIRSKLAEAPKFSDLGHRTIQSIGLKNIYSRIQLYYGQTYRFEIESDKSSGTKITLILPIINSEENNE